MGSPSLSSSTQNHPGAGFTASPRPEHDLTTFFLKAKRSLESKDLIFRAADLVNNTKAALENAATLLPKCVYLRNALEGQLAAVRSLNGAMTQTKRIFVGVVQVWGPWGDRYRGWGWKGAFDFHDLWNGD